MKKKKLFSLALVLAMALSMVTACGKSTSGTQQSTTTEAVSTSSAETTQSTTEVTTQTESVSDTAAVDENKAAADQLLVDLTGTYEELWPVILDDKYTSVWLENCKALVGEENAQAAFDKLSSMVTGEVYGEEAVKAYANGGGAYDCSFTEGVVTLEFDGKNSTIKGYAADGSEIFSHTYHYVGMEEIRGLYEYESDDADSGEFTYFCIAPDTSDTTYHIELRYGSDLTLLGQYAEGKYAYWLGSGISTSYDETMIEKCIELFCNENLSE